MLLISSYAVSQSVLGMVIRINRSKHYLKTALLEERQCKFCSEFYNCSNRIVKFCFYFFCIIKEKKKEIKVRVFFWGGGGGYFASFV